MDNNAKLGFTLQSMICNKYKIKPNAIKAINCFNSVYDSKLEIEMMQIIEDIFSSLKNEPIECTTFQKSNVGGRDLPYNFILEDNSTLSIRTNISGGMVAPREVGQAGYEKLNKYFGKIYGKRIQSQQDIKNLFMFSVEKILPIFFDFLFDADYIVWIYNKDNNYKYQLIKGDLGVNIDFSKENFCFTKTYEEWVESTTLKYKGISIAEVQIHKNRTFKFRFKMKNVLPFIFEKKINNETLGITAEKTICDLFALDYPKNFLKRYSVEMQYQIMDVIAKAFEFLPMPIKYCGNMQGERGSNSKCSYDFILEGNKTLSLKTNMGKKVCPPEVGQPNDKTCYKYFKDYVTDDFITKDNFKKMVFQYIDKLLSIYLTHMFDSDFLLRIYECKKNEIELSGYSYGFDIIPKNFGADFIWNKEKISFSQDNIILWKESNTVYYLGMPLGEFQVHNNRNCFKFRFNFDNLIKIIKNNL